jgi:NAD(P)-dependent dehydrogenase (short-subunit alcohol dehydrogenase family)
MRAYPAVKEKTVLVTGAGGGIGRAAARALAAADWRVFPTARSWEDLDALRAEGFQPVELDLADEDSVASAAGEVLSLAQGGLGAIVNNAGYGVPGAVEDLSRPAWRKQFETNVFGTFDLTRRLAGTFRAQGWGRIVLVSSVVARVSVPFLGVYSASKAALEAAGDAMRVELAAAGVAVSIVEPGPIATGFRRRCVREGREALEPEGSAFRAQYAKELASEVRTFKRPTDVFRAGPEAVAKAIVHALEAKRPRIRYPVTGAAWLGVLADSFFPAWFIDRLMEKKVIAAARG